MRYKSYQSFKSDPDMTPMIDCTLQLVIFFLLTLNFSSDEQSELIRLPSSEIVKPTEASEKTAISIQVLRSGEVLFGGDRMTPEALHAPLEREKNVIKNVLRRNMKNAAAVIRADRDAPTGKVQDVIRECQDAEFETFILRAKWKEP